MKYNKLPNEYLQGTMDIIYHVAENIEYKFNIDVKTESGKVLNTIQTVSHFTGDKI